MLLNIKCVLILSTLFVWNILILRRNQRDIIKLYVDFHVKDPLFFSDLYETWIFSAYFEKNPHIRVYNLMKIHSLGSELFLSDGWTDRQTETNIIQVLVPFRSFVQAPETDVC
jgi:hypothetical protein